MNIGTAWVLLIAALPASAQSPGWPKVEDVELQPLVAQVRRVVDSLEMIGQPMPAETRDRLDLASRSSDASSSIREIQAVLDPYCLIGVEINPESRVKSMIGPAPAVLDQQGWRGFLIKVANQAGVTAELKAESPNAAATVRPSSGSPTPPSAVSPSDLRDRWLSIGMYQDRPLQPRLSGLGLEYRIIQIYSRDAGRREAKITFNVGQGTQDLGFRSDVDILFQANPAVDVILDIRDEYGRDSIASLLIRDRFGRVYPAQGRRLAPDFFFHPQIYRKSGESVLLPPGTYTLESARGPEYLATSRPMAIPAGRTHRESISLERWIDPARFRWFSGDHHVHAAGCAHYETPSEGVRPEDMMRHLLGEDLKVGCVLSWGPCWYAQKQFFDGKLHPLSTPDHLMRYDVEVSGFPSSHTGHLCLLRLKEDDYPGTARIEEWPSWDLPVLKWGKQQGGVVGFSHSGWGLQTRSRDLPNYDVPPFDGIGANEYLVDVVHDAVDFISAVDTPAPWELNIWYHTLNCGFRCRISGETDFPCIYGERVGLGRSYVKLDTPKPDFEAWTEGIKQGRSYVSDGKSHLMDFHVDDVAVGENGGERKLDAPGPVRVSAKVAALLPASPTAEGQAIRGRPIDQKPYWDLERARIGDSRMIPVEVVVNGKAAALREVVADGSVHDLDLDVPINRSGWVALRIYPSSHTNPIWVTVGGKPVRASRRSADWCLKGVDQCWSQKVKNTRNSELAEAEAAYETARAAYRLILAESEVD
ncbi:MAG: CehA/McbA family metallohydrolase [Isosphaeraceae bacterium]